MRFDLSDEEWALLEPLLPKGRKNARVNDRQDRECDLLYQRLWFLTLRGFRPSAISDSLARGGFAPCHQR